MLELNLAIRPIMWKNMANYLERIQISALLCGKIWRIIWNVFRFLLFLQRALLKNRHARLLNSLLNTTLKLTSNNIFYNCI